MTIEAWRDRDWLKDRYITQGKNTVQIASELGCAQSTVGTWLRHHKIRVRDQSESQGCPHILKDCNWLEDQYVNQSKSTRQIASELGCSQPTVSRWLRRHEIQARDMGCQQILKNREWLEDQYITQQKTTYQIASELGCGQPTVTNWLRNHDIPARDNSGKNNPCWRGGSSFEPYCPKFNNQRKEQVRDQFGRKCLICGQPENGKKLAVHHVDYNKMQGCGHSWNLVPLCASCHAITNTNRFHWFNLLQNWWVFQPDINFAGSTFSMM